MYMSTQNECVPWGEVIVEGSACASSGKMSAAEVERSVDEITVFSEQIGGNARSADRIGRTNEIERCFYDGKRIKNGVFLEVEEPITCRTMDKGSIERSR